MGYARHSALDLSLAASQVITAIPTTDELVILLRGSVTSGAAADIHRIRPNSDSTTSYGTVIHAVASNITEGITATPTNGLHMGRDGSGCYQNTTGRLVKVGNVWVWSGQSVNEKTSLASGESLRLGGFWNSGGSALSTLQFRWDVDTALARFTGRLEVWYQNA